MSTEIYKSPLLTNTGLKYQSDSVVRFMAGRNAGFFSAYNLTEEEVVKLINHCISVSGVHFSVSYYTASNLPVLYITGGKPQTKMYFYNMKTSRHLVNHSPISQYMQINATEEIYERLHNLSDSLNITKGEIITLALLNEFEPNPFILSDKNSSNRSMLACASRLRMDVSVALPDTPQVQVDERFAITDYDDLAVSMAEFATELLPNPADDLPRFNHPVAIERFTAKIKRKLKKRFNQLESVGDWSILKYTLSGLDIAGNVLVSDLLPIDFDITKLELMYLQNAAHYAGCYQLLVCDPITGQDFVFYPHGLPSASQKNKQHMNLSIPSDASFWLASVSGFNTRTRSSLVEQAGSRYLSKWYKETKHLSDKSKAEIALKLSLFANKSMVGKRASLTKPALKDSE